jgi:HSP20 family protein
MMRSPFFSDILSLRNTLDRVMNDSFNGSPFRTPWSDSDNGTSVTRAMPLDVYATDDEAVIIAAVPGMRPDDLDVTVHQNTISLTGKIGNVSDTEAAKGATWYLQELGSGSYHRSITLPFQINADDVQASFENGIVRVVLPKAEQAKPRKIALNYRQPEAVGAGSGNSKKK